MAGRRAALRRPGAAGLQRRGVAGPRQTVKAPWLIGAVGLGVQVEGPVGRQAQRPGQGSAAVGFLRLGVEQQGLVAPKVEDQLQVIAGMHAAERPQIALLAAQPRGLVVAAQVEVAGPAAELGPGDQAQGDTVQVHRQRRGAGLALGGQGRAAQHDDLAGGDLVGVEAAVEQLGRPPVDIEVGGLEPDALFVADRQAADPERAPDVARQAFDLQAADAAQLQAAGARLQEGAALRRDRRRSARRPAARRPAPPGSPRR
jgi:hypothetical protein